MSATHHNPKEHRLMTTPPNTSPRRGDVVHASSGGHRYHTTPKCHVLRSAQDLWDLDSPDDEPVLGPCGGGYAVREGTVQDAVMRGKLPCLACRPPVAFPPLYGLTFGHDPVHIDGDQFCARCRTPWSDEHGDEGAYPTLWPCTSAVVLGLVSRRTTSTEGARAA